MKNEQWKLKWSDFHESFHQSISPPLDMAVQWYNKIDCVSNSTLISYFDRICILRIQLIVIIAVVQRPMPIGHTNCSTRKCIAIKLELPLKRTKGDEIIRNNFSIVHFNSSATQQLQRPPPQTRRAFFTLSLSAQAVIRIRHTLSSIVHCALCILCIAAVETR